MGKSHNNKPASMPADVGFGLGFFCGSIIAAVGVYLSISPSGRQLKQQIKDEFDRHHQKILVERLVVGSASIKQDSSSSVEVLDSLRQLISKIKLIINPDRTKSVEKHSSSSSQNKKKQYFKQK